MSGLREEAWQHCVNGNRAMNHALARSRIELASKLPEQRFAGQTHRKGMTMKKTIVGLVTLGALATLGLTTPVFAAPNQDAKQPSEKQEKGQPFHGKIEELDATAKTMKVGTATIYVTEATKLTRHDKTIKFAEMKVGEEVHGTTKVTFDGKTEALTVKMGPKEDKAPAPPGDVK
jgi:hypothetical protein